MTRGDLVDRIWTDGAEYVDENALSVTIKRLRDKPVSYTHLDVYKRQLYNRLPRQFPAVFPYEPLLTWRRFYPHQLRIRKRISNVLYYGFPVSYTHLLKT